MWSRCSGDSTTRTRFTYACLGATGLLGAEARASNPKPLTYLTDPSCSRRAREPYCAAFPPAPTHALPQPSRGGTSSMRTPGFTCALVGSPCPPLFLWGISDQGGDYPLGSVLAVQVVSDTACPWNQVEQSGVRSALKVSLPSLMTVTHLALGVIITAILCECWMPLGLVSLVCLKGRDMYRLTTSNI